MSGKLKVLFLSAEASPLVKIGGLGDVAGSLPSELKSLPESPDIRVALPFYPSLKNTGLDIAPICSFEIAHSNGPLPAEVFETALAGVQIYLIDGPPVASSDAVYSGDNTQDGAKFTFFSLAALELCRVMNWQPDILHAHDWHAAPAVYNLHLIKDRDVFFQDTKTLLTVHNLPYLGYGSEKALQAFGLPRAHLSTLPDWAEHLPLPLGLLSADKINTVSPGYAAEMLTPEFGAHLEDFLATRQGDILGILNGLDLLSWDPETDPGLPVNYSSETLERRKENKKQLLEDLELDPNPDIPLLAMINRMDYQKGVDLVPPALEMITKRDWQAVILGTGDQELEESARQLDLDYPRVRSVLEFDGRLARQIYGGSDLILIPSRYEPCGLTQMIGMRYGCVPLARATGGLKDTIIDYHEGKAGTSTGFFFQEPTAEALSDSLVRALDVFYDQRRWKGLQKRGMKVDFSWKRSAIEYMDLYQELLSGR
jgi:starch synthase